MKGKNLYKDLFNYINDMFVYGVKNDFHCDMCWGAISFAYSCNGITSAQNEELKNLVLRLYDKLPADDVVS